MKELEFAKKMAFSSEETLMFSYECAMNMKDSEGDFVECGVAAGAQVIAMLCGAPNKTIHAFDSFEGIPLPSNKDDQMPGIRWLSEKEISDLPDPGKQKLESTGATVFSEETFKRNISIFPKNKVVIHKGWFENTVPGNTIGKISILRLDGDLYNSTWVCLSYLFNKVIKGGIVIIDDWQLPGCRKACEDYFKWAKYKPKYINVSNIVYFEK